MGTINRDKDISEQKQLVEVMQTATVTGGLYPVYTAPRAQTLVDARNVGMGLSGAPTSALFLNRFVVGTGAASYAIGGALTVTAFGTSGMQQYSLPAVGNSVLALQAGDTIYSKTGGSSAALDANLICLVVQNIQDISTWNFNT